MKKKKYFFGLETAKYEEYLLCNLRSTKEAKSAISPVGRGDLLRALHILDIYTIHGRLTGKFDS